MFKLLQFASPLPKEDPFCKALISRFLAPKEDTQGELNELMTMMHARQLNVSEPEKKDQKEQIKAPGKCCDHKH